MSLEAKKSLQGLRTTKGTHLLESISTLFSIEISIFYVVFVAEQAGLGMAWSKTQKTEVLR